MPHSTEFPTKIFRSFIDKRQRPNTDWDIAVLHRDRLVFEYQTVATPMIAAGLGILAITCAALEKDISLTEKLTIQPEDKVEGNGAQHLHPSGCMLPFDPEGTGILRYFPPGFSMSFQRVAWHALARDDHTAAKMIVRTLGGPQEVNSTLAGLDYEDTFLLPCNITDTSPTAFWEYGPMSAHASTRLLSKNLSYMPFADPLAKTIFCKGLRRIESQNIRSSPKLSKPHAQLKNWFLLQQKHQGKETYPSEIILDNASLQQEPSGAFPNKIGIRSRSGLCHEVAQIGKYTVAVMSRSEAVNSFRPPDQSHAHNLQACLGKFVYEILC